MLCSSLSAKDWPFQLVNKALMMSASGGVEIGDAVINDYFLQPLHNPPFFNALEALSLSYPFSFAPLPFRYISSKTFSLSPPI